MDKYPDLKICLGHAGGYVPFAVDRMYRGWEQFPEYRGLARDRPSTYLHSFYYDTVTFTDRNLRFLIDSIGADRVVLGTDWPAPVAVSDPVRRLEGSMVTDDERDSIGILVAFSNSTEDVEARLAILMSARAKKNNS